MTNYVGISCGFHDAALSVIDSTGNILFAGHSERYSMKKHDSKLCSGIVEDAKNHINDDFEVHYYERPYVKAVRQFIAKQKLGPFNVNQIIGKHNLYQLESFKHIRQGKVKTHNHHLCHAAAGFQTSPYQDATVVVIDAIGELDTISIWDAKYDKEGKATYKKIWGRRYPDSIGLFYSAMTHRVGLRPLDEEYILMGMAAYGKPLYTGTMQRLFSDFEDIVLEDNLHIGVDEDFLKDADEMDIASSAQAVVEQLIEAVIKKAKKLGKSDNLVYGGGVALNCLANRLIGKHYQNTWIMPNPGDAGNSLGAAALGYGKKINWTDAFLGFDIKGEYPVDNILKELYTNKMVGVASGRAEFGPRALGNRSLLADPRGPEIKDKVNDIKRRQQFRPFAPVILEELVTDYFDMPSGWSDSRYMQVIATCRHPDLFPAIVHADGTSRVQTVANDGSGIRKLLEAWYKETGCPMLLNTSLNIRGEPMVNDRSDADRFEKLYNLKVCS
jgi:carbamoyltransferase